MRHHWQYIKRGLGQAFPKGTAAFALLAVFISGCSVSLPSAQATHTTGSNQAVAATPGATMAPGSAAASVPLFNSSTAIQAMQRWASEVHSGRIADGAVTRTPANSGWVRDWFHLSTYMPYGTYRNNANPFRPVPNSTDSVVIGSVEYVFTYRDLSSASTTYRYGALIGTASSSGQPVTLLVWLSARDATSHGLISIVQLATQSAAGYPVVGVSDSPPAVGYSVAYDSDIALWLASPAVLHRTVSLIFGAQFPTAGSGPGKGTTTTPQVPAAWQDAANRNNHVMAQVAAPAYHQASDGVFATVPTTTVSISPSDGAVFPSFIVLPFPTDVGF